MIGLPNLFDSETRRLAQELYCPRSAQIQQAADNAEALDDTFSDRADAWIASYAASHGEFTASKCTNAARLLIGLECPAHGGWGSRFKMAQRNGIIVRVGFAPRKNGNHAPLYIGLMK